MCSTGGGNSFFESVLDVGLQLGTFGLVGFKDDEGGLSAGITGEPLVDVLKDVTGATAAEEANQLARQSMEEAKAAELQAREDARSQTAANQIAASRRAQALRTPSGTGAPSTSPSAIGGVTGDERDFLGV